MTGTAAALAPGPRIERAVTTTDGSGVASFTWTPPFAAAPVVTIALQAGAGFRSARLASNTAAGCTVAVLEAAGITLLGVGVLAAGSPASGVQVHATAIEA